ncbi:hypothetical protein AURDEDRAFT_133715 [Auricularia subglabra TFB-10046 SS5]|nr:hypothetical protein AURDEDRAFT_133715 [Auricularia subglabra TFB-10046 SS5]
MSSSTRQLPAVRLPPALSPTRDIQPSDKFELHWPRDPHASPPRAHPPPQPPLSAPDDADAAAYPWNDPEPAEPDATPTSDGKQAPAPRLARAFSMPLPSQLGHLRHPRRDPSHVASPLLNGGEEQATQFNELSLELADSVQMVIQTILQLSPPHLLDLAKEQFAACAVQIPTPSISAVLTSMKNLNYMSAHMPELSALDVSPPPPRARDDVQADFDVGEMLQNVGDALSGVAAQAGVDLVLFHADVGMKHISVRGDECGLSYALSFIVRQVLQVCRPGETVELGLQILTAGSQTPSSTSDPDLSMSPPTHSPMLDATGPLDISFDIIHRFAPPSSDAWNAADGDPELYPPTPEQPFTTDDAATPVTTNAPPPPPVEDERAPPDFSALLLRRLLRHVGATLRTEQTPTSSKKHIATLALTLQRGAPLPEPPCLSAADAAARQPFPDLKLAQEPTLAELAAFTEQLRGKKVMFHANSSGSFARHLSGYLTSWGMDVSHVPTDDHEEKVAGMSVPLERTGTGSVRLEGHEPQSGMESPHSAGPNTSSPTFVVIDDDAQVLRRRLLQLRAQAPYIQMKPKRQRPALAVHHRPRSTHSVRQYSSGLPQINEPEMQYQNVVIVHFTSLANYKVVKDMLQNTLSSPVGGVSNMPEVIVVPKPAGPRRFLTALYTAVNKPVVDPFFLPIATSPMSPGTQAMAPFFSGVPSSLRHRQGSTASNGSAGNAASGSGSNAGRSPRIGGESSLQPATPLAMDGIEYFSETAAKKVGGTPAAGVVIQSPDGRPAGIFFQPQPRLNRSGSQSSKAGSGTGARRMSNGRGERKALEDFGEAARDAARLGTNVSQIPLDPSKLMRRTFNTPMSSFAMDTSDATSGEESSSGAMPPPPRPVVGNSPGSSTVRQPRRSSASAMPPGHTLRATSPPAHGSPSTAPPDESTIRVNLGRYTPQRIAPPGPPSPTAVADAAQALARGSLGRKSGTPFTEPPTTVKSPPTSPPSGSASTPPVSIRKPTRKSADGDVFTDATPSRPIRKGNNKAPIWRTGAQMDIVPPINVLVVEDNLINRTILSTALKKMGVKYGQASNGQEAIEKWRKGDFHLILMDIHMPVMDGITATREIRRLEAGPRPIPSPSLDAPHAPESYLTLQPPGGGSPFRSSVIIVALTASNLNSDRIAALAAGCNDYIQKPVSLEWLHQKIMEWGSIKALQMWADVPAKFDAQQDQKALDIASQLKLPRSRTTSPDTRRPRKDERSPSPSGEPREQGQSVSAASTRSASPAPSSSAAPVLALASASEESLAIPPTPEDERRPASPALIASSDTIPLHVHPPDDAGVDDTSFVPLDKTASGTPPAAELPGGLPVELDSTTDSDAGLGARE